MLHPDHPCIKFTLMGLQQGWTCPAVLLMPRGAAHSHLDEPAGYVRVMLFDFSSALTTIRPDILGDKLEGRGWNTPLLVEYLGEQLE